MAWLANRFPLFFLQLKKLIIYAVFIHYLYTGYTHRFVMVYNRMLELHALKLCKNYLSLFMLIMIADTTFDILIFWRFVPFCF